MAKDKQNNTSIAMPIDDLSKIFAPQKRGFLGADADLSIPLSDSRTLWIFGDTIIGNKNGSERNMKFMPRNTIAIEQPGEAVFEKFEWIFKDKNGRVADFFVYDDKDKNNWLWITAGCAANNELFLFGYEITHKQSKCEAMSFKVLKNYFIYVPDTSGHPLDWKQEKYPLIHPFEHALFASACFIEKTFLYLFGTEYKSKSSLIKNVSATLSRIRIKDLRKRNNSFPFEYYGVKNGIIGWYKNPDNLIPLYNPGVSESTVYFDAPRKRYIATTYYVNTPDFYVISAPSLIGKWSEPVKIFRENRFKPLNKYFYYALRMHPHLASSEDEMIFSYIVNSKAVADLLNNSDIYYPRFLRIDLNKI